MAMMMLETPELLIIAINLSLILISYLLVYPWLVGSNFDKLVINDLIVSSISLLISGSIFWGAGVNFNALLFTANWFWFSILTYLIIELPFMTRYMKKYAPK